MFSIIKLKLKKCALMTLGSIFLAIGVVGIIIPMLPTTPFLLLASFCYLRSSRALHNWLINHRFFGPPIADYVQYGAVKRSAKFVSIAMLWLSLAISIFIVQLLSLRLLLVVIGTMVSFHIIKLKERKPELG